MKRINKQTYIGVDGLELQVNTDSTKLRKENIESKELYSKRTGVKIGRVKAINSTGFRLYINLPQMVRANNIRPFGIIDKIYLEEVLNEITGILYEFCVDVHNALVSTVEINATAQLDSKKSVECIMNLLALMFLQEGKKVFLTAHGKKNSYKSVPLSYDILRNTYQIESLKTPRLGNKAFSWKFYDKGLEEGIQDKGVLRLEQVHNSRSLKREGLPQRLDLFLTSENILKLISIYRRSFQRYFIDVYWKYGRQCFVDKCVNTILFELKEESPLSAAKVHKNLISIDFEIFERACRLFYPNQKTATQTIRRVRNSGKIEVNKGAVRELVQVFRAILYSK